MRAFLKRRSRQLRVAWLWPLVLLTLPTCGLDASGINCCGDGDPGGGGGDDKVFVFEPGDDPTSAVMCYIPQLPATDSNSFDFPCVTDPAILGIGMPSTQAAVALNLGDGNSVVLDYSQASFTQCGTGIPRRIDLFDSFPKGTTVCVDCLQQIPNPYADRNAVCVAKCTELVIASTGLPQSQAESFCGANAHISTNFEKNECYNDVCTMGGTPTGSFADPRINPENVTWINTTSTVNGNTLTFSGPAAPGGAFDGGAASDEIISDGDAWVEFAAGELGVTHVIGVRTTCADFSCPDGDDTLTDIPLAISLNVDGHTNIVENGVLKYTDAHDYQLTDRYRIHVVDRHDGTGTADIFFTRFTEGSCPAGGPCTETPVYTYTGTPPNYPLRVDTTFREAPASLVDVTIMRIKP